MGNTRTPGRGESVGGGVNNQIHHLSYHFKFIEAINSKGIHVGIEIETRKNRNKFSSWVTPFY
jgi:hypothetical protein